MAITILNNLYPPLITNDCMPAFIYTDSCKIYFTLSSYNNIDDLHLEYPIQMIVHNVKTNQNILSKQKYPSGIKLCQMIKDTENLSLLSEKRYYVQLKSSDTQNGFNLNEYYQVQIRFTGKEASSPPSTGIGIDGWLSNNLSYFSQWSTIALIYGISTPQLKLKYYEVEEDNINPDSSLRAIVSGSLVFSESRDKQKLKNYKILLQDIDNPLIIYEDSGLLYPNDYVNTNQLFYRIKYNIIQDKYYKVVIQIETKNGYSFSTWFNYKWVPTEERPFDVSHEVIADNENGGLRIKITSKNNELIQNPTHEIRFSYDEEESCVMGKAAYLIMDKSVIKPQTAMVRSAMITDDQYKLILINWGSPIEDLAKDTKIFIQRSSSKDNFSTWIEISRFLVEEDLLSALIFDDYTVEPGVWYKYKIIRKDSGEDFSSEIITDKNMVYTDHIFLSAGARQLKICYDPQISNFSIKTSDTLIETIGSQYPYIRREGNLYYKTFSLSGTISYLSDMDINLFNSSKDELYLNNQITQLYDQYNQNNNIGLYKDFIRQKKFRDEVIKFLYDNNIKLFRSLTQGNLLVKLTNITLVPNTTLGRMIYSFSCTVCQIADPTEENIIDNISLYKKSEIR